MPGIEFLVIGLAITLFLAVIAMMMLLLDVRKDYKDERRKNKGR